MCRDAFVQLVGEEFIKLYSFAGTPIESALRDFLHTLLLIGETQERERVLSHFSRRYIDCNPNTFKSFGLFLPYLLSVLPIAALML